VKYVATKKARQQIIFLTFLLKLLLDPGSEIGVQNNRPGSATLLAKNTYKNISHFCTLQITLGYCRRYRQHRRRLVSCWRAGGPQLWMRNRQSPVLPGGRGRGWPHPSHTRGRSRAWPPPAYRKGKSRAWPPSAYTRGRRPACPPLAHTRERSRAWPPLAYTRRSRAWPPLALKRGRSPAWPPLAFTRVRRPAWPPLAHPQPRRPSPDHPFLVKIFKL
jgi:hypothetical protein